MGKVSDSQKKARDKWDGENMVIIGYKENKQKIQSSRQESGNNSKFTLEEICS